jgi:hypothetical protein
MLVLKVLVGREGEYEGSSVKQKGKLRTTFCGLCSNEKKLSPRRANEISRIGSLQVLMGIANDASRRSRNSHGTTPEVFIEIIASRFSLDLRFACSPAFPQWLFCVFFGS